jgi:hypothetical protein
VPILERRSWVSLPTKAVAKCRREDKKNLGPETGPGILKTRQNNICAEFIK